MNMERRKGSPKRRFPILGGSISAVECCLGGLNITGSRVFLQNRKAHGPFGSVLEILLFQPCFSSSARSLNSRAQAKGSSDELIELISCALSQKRLGISKNQSPKAVSARALSLAGQRTIAPPGGRTSHSV